MSGIQTQTGTFNDSQALDISAFYEISIWVNVDIQYPLPIIQVSNDGNTWAFYKGLTTNYLYLNDLMANYIQVISGQGPLTISYNANLKSSM